MPGENVPRRVANKRDGGRSIRSGLAAASACLASGGDDVASFYVAERLQVGSVNLEPGIYVVRALHSGSSPKVLVVSNVEGTANHAALLVTPHQVAPQEVKAVSRLLYEVGDGSRPAALRTFLVANSSFGYDIAVTASPARIASANEKEIVAIASAR